MIRMILKQRFIFPVVLFEDKQSTSLCVLIRFITAIWHLEIKQKQQQSQLKKDLITPLLHFDTLTIIAGELPILVAACQLQLE